MKTNPRDTQERRNESKAFYQRIGLFTIERTDILLPKKRPFIPTTKYREKNLSKRV
jgi:hypothetical protein